MGGFFIAQKGIRHAGGEVLSDCQNPELISLLKSILEMHFILY